MKIPKAWQNAIEKVIQEADGGERPDIAAAFRESEERYLSEIKISVKPGEAEIIEIGDSYLDFGNGWNAATQNFAKEAHAGIISWIRAHGEPTDYCQMEEPDVKAVIVKESDLANIS